MKPEHKRISRMLGNCLIQDSSGAWSGFGRVAAALPVDMAVSAKDRAALVRHISETEVVA